jgi:hypothetical protein
LRLACRDQHRSELGTCVALRTTNDSDNGTRVGCGEGRGGRLPGLEGTGINLHNGAFNQSLGANLETGNLKSKEKLASSSREHPPTRCWRRCRKPPRYECTWFGSRSTRRSFRGQDEGRGTAKGNKHASMDTEDRGHEMAKRQAGGTFRFPPRQRTVRTRLSAVWPP